MTNTSPTNERLQENARRRNRTQLRLLERLLDLTLNLGTLILFVTFAVVLGVLIAAALLQIVH